LGKFGARFILPVLKFDELNLSQVFLSRGAQRIKFEQKLRRKSAGFTGRFLPHRGRLRLLAYH